MSDCIPTTLARTPSDELLIHWSDGSTRRYQQRELRLACPCAHCIDEFTGEALLDPKSVSEHIRIDRLKTIGRYALSLHFSDRHATGIFPWSLLRRLGTPQI